MHILLLLIGICPALIFSQGLLQLQPPVTLSVNVFFDNQRVASAVQSNQNLPPNVDNLGSFPGLPALHRIAGPRQIPGFPQYPYPLPPVRKLTNLERLKLACDAVFKSISPMKEDLRHQTYVCQQTFKDEAERMGGVALRKMSNDDGPSEFFNITAEFCTDRRCSKFVTPQAADLASFKPESSGSVTKIVIKSGRIPVLFYGAVVNMPKLENLTMDSVSTEIVEAKAFDKLPNLKYLSLKDNFILMIRAGVFTALVALEELHLEHNALIAISPNAFANMASLTYLGLTYNSLDTFDDRWFQNNLNLTQLHLEHNNLTKISSNAFRTLNLKNDIAIYLERNKIESIGPDLFDHNANNKISALHLNFNSLTCIAGDLKNFFVPSTVHLIGNPLRCNCLKDIVEYTYSNFHPTISMSPLTNCNLDINHI